MGFCWVALLVSELVYPCVLSLFYMCLCPQVQCILPYLLKLCLWHYGTTYLCVYNWKWMATCHFYMYMVLILLIEISNWMWQPSIIFMSKFAARALMTTMNNSRKLLFTVLDIIITKLFSNIDPIVWAKSSAFFSVDEKEPKLFSSSLHVSIKRFNLDRGTFGNFFY